MFMQPLDWQQRNGAIVEVQEGTPFKVITNQTKLDKYALKGQISREGHEAGLQFHRKWMTFTRSGPVTSGYGQRVSGSEVDAYEQADAREKVNEAIKELGRDTAAIIIDVCALDISVYTSGRTLRMGKDKAIKTLADGLENLAGMWGLIT